MNLETVARHRLYLSLNVVGTDAELAEQIQDRLIALNFLNTACCGFFEKGCNCKIALYQFQKLHGLATGLMDDCTALALLERKAS